MNSKTGLTSVIIAGALLFLKKPIEKRGKMPLKAPAGESLREGGEQQ